MGGGGDPYWNNVSYLLVGNGANGTTTNIKDSSKNNLATTVNGSVVISTAQSKFSTGSSVYFPGASGDYLQPASNLELAFGIGDFTLEAWVFTPNSNTTYAITDSRVSGVGFWFGTDGAGSPLSVYLAGGLLLSGGSVSANSWHYVVACRTGTTFNLYIDGTRVATTSNSTDLTSTQINIGKHWSSAYNWNGYMYDLRITKGVARYSGATMTVPTAPLPIG
jgi:hypothetical protein